MSIRYWNVSPLLMIALLAAGTHNAAAHGGLAMDKDMCKLRVGPYVMHFTGYQPEATGTKEFCEDIPDAGPTVVVLDAVDQPLRSLPLGVRIIADTGNESDIDAITVLHLPPKTYPTGSVSFNYSFTKPGKFIGLVSVQERGQTYVSRFPFSVASGWPAMNVYFLIAGVILAGGLLYWYSVSFVAVKAAAGRKKSA